jgi:hypothetical protein
MGSDDPALEQPRHQVNVGHDYQSRLAAGAEADSFVAVAGSRHVPVAAPRVGQDRGARLDSFLDERGEGCRRHVGNAAHSNPTDATLSSLGGDHHDRLVRGVAPDRALLCSADVGLVDLDLAAQAVPPWPHHGPAQLVQPDPGGLVAAQPQDSLEAQGTDTVLLADRIPRQPQTRWQSPSCRRSCSRSPKSSRHRPCTSNGQWQPASPVRPDIGDKRIYPASRGAQSSVSMRHRLRTTTRTRATYRGSPPRPPAPGLASTSTRY